MSEPDTQCPKVDPIWATQCTKEAGHSGFHQADTDDEIVTWGTVEEIRIIKRGE